MAASFSACSSQPTAPRFDEIARRTDSAMDDMERGRKVCVGGDQCGEY
jgi:hypothetical protein